MYLHGAHVTSWTDALGREAFWVSRRARWSPDAPIRGGVPVVFPQFADRGPLPKHGFARVARWELAEAGSERSEDDGPVRVRLRLGDDEHTRALWPHPFRAELRISLDERLEMELRISNPGTAALEFTAALHSYFRVAEAARAEVHGLEGAAFRDNTRDNAPGVQREPALRIRGETDRVYADAPDRVRIDSGGAVLLLHKRGFPDAVVWNPGPELARELDDFGDDEFREMLCVEAAVVERPVRLEPGAEWSAGQALRWEDAGEQE